MSHIPRKRFGQNFLRDRAVIDRIIRAIGPAATDHIVEIGPGEGVLTRHLADAAGRLDAIELDRDLAAELRQFYAVADTVKVHQTDALRFDFASLTSGRPLRVVGNLPYNISTPLLFHLFSHAGLVSDMHFMLQKEVVDRLTAPSGSGDYGRLSIMAGYHCQAEKLFEVAPESFFPRPKVISAIVRLIPHAAPPVDCDPADLGRVVTAAFSQRRKTLRNSLASVLSDDDLRAVGIDPSLRAEKLELEDFSRLAKRWRERAGHATPPAGAGEVE